MNETRRFALPLLAAGQAQKEVTHNEALLAIDRLLHLAIESRSLAAPPATPAAGTAYLVAPGASGDWAGRSGQIATYDGFGWTFLAPRAGMAAYIIDEAGFVALAPATVPAHWPVNGLRIAGRNVLAAPAEAIAAPSGGAVVDGECRNGFNALLVALRRQGIVL
jgi:hypothetical protein